MFNIGPLELMVLAIVGLIVLGPDRLPNLARDAARMIRSLRDMATGAREQLRDELGPEFADVDLRNLNPRTAVQRAVFGEELNLSKLNPRNAVRDAIFGDEDLKAADPRAAVRDAVREDDPPVSTPAAASSPGPASTPAAASTPPVSTVKPTSRPNPGPSRPAPGPATPYDSDAT